MENKQKTQGEAEKKAEKEKEDQVMRDAPITPPKKTKGMDEAPATPPVAKAQLPYRPRKTPVGQSLPTKNRKTTETASSEFVSMKAFVVHGVLSETHKRHDTGFKEGGYERNKGSKMAPRGKPENRQGHQLGSRVSGRQDLLCHI